MKQNKCECDERGVLNPIIASLYDSETELPFVNHKPNMCKCTNDIKKYIRNGKKIDLCSCCVLSSDIEAEDNDEEEND